MNQQQLPMNPLQSLMSPLQLLNFQLRLQMSLPLSLKNLLLLQMNLLQSLNFQPL